MFNEVGLNYNSDIPEADTQDSKLLENGTIEISSDVSDDVIIDDNESAELDKLFALDMDAEITKFDIDVDDMLDVPINDIEKSTQDITDIDDINIDDIADEYFKSDAHGNAEVNKVKNLYDEFSGRLGFKDYMAIYKGLDEYSFNEANYLKDPERLDSCLRNFTAENWQRLTLEEKKVQINNLAEYVIDVTGNENPPKIEFYNNPRVGEYGGYISDKNVLVINEYMLYENDEAADTISHELWHAYQHNRAANPRTKIDYMYRENFEDYITPDEDFEGYQAQLVEAEARAFAQQFKDRLSSY